MASFSSGGTGTSSRLVTSHCSMRSPSCLIGKCSQTTSLRTSCLQRPLPWPGSLPCGPGRTCCPEACLPLHSCHVANLAHVLSCALCICRICINCISPLVQSGIHDSISFHPSADRRLSHVGKLMVCFYPFWAVSLCRSLTIVTV